MIDCRGRGVDGVVRIDGLGRKGLGRRQRVETKGWGKEVRGGGLF